CQKTCEEADYMLEMGDAKSEVGRFIVDMCRLLQKLQRGMELQEQVWRKLYRKKFEVAENMFESGESKSQVWRFLLDMFRVLPSILLRRAFWKISLKSVLPVSALTRLKRLSIVLSPIGGAKK